MESVIINICNISTRQNGRHISSKSNFFNQPIIIKFSTEKIEFIRVGIDYQGKIRHFSFDKKAGQYHGTVLFEAPVGKFISDEDDSNEDVIVFYF
jgi:hypothetical protein